ADLPRGRGTGDRIPGEGHAAARAAGRVGAPPRLPELPDLPAPVHGHHRPHPPRRRRRAAAGRRGPFGGGDEGRADTRGGL
ncbi:MAG: hypothetical protein AVDCRST_MAG04-3258, partial [uncultured Acetobacteraceae bacterium]